jgi:hypothetical protein
MFKRILIALLFVGGLSAQTTDNADLRNLTKEQQLVVLQKVEELKKENPGAQAVKPTTPEQASKWIALGKDVAELIPVFAEKTGIAADRVLNSFSGKVLLTIVIVHFFWSKLIGICILLFGLPIWWHWFRNMFLVESQTATAHPNTFLAWFGLTKRTTIYASLRSMIKGDGHISDVEAIWLVLAATSLLGLILCAGFGIFG